jgi:hypothetical protein
MPVLVTPKNVLNKGDSVSQRPKNSPIIIRTSERRDFKRCVWRWHMGWRQGLRPHRDSNPLWFGQGIHICLADWYQEGLKRGPHPAKTWKKFIREESDRLATIGYGTEDEKRISLMDLGEEMMVNYVEHYGRDDHTHTIAIEQPFQVSLFDPDDPDTLLAIFAGTFDGVYRDLRTGEIWLWEHKTAAAIQTNHLPMDDQAGGYWLVADTVLREKGLIGPEEYISGIMYNFLLKRPRDTRDRNAAGLCLNKDGSVSKSQPKPLFERVPVNRTPGERETQLRRLTDELKVMQAFRGKSRLPLIKNPTKDCSWDCNFYKMCQLHEQGEDGDWQAFQATAYSRRDPYADHRENRKSA